jgi:uncharacterized protein YndB with AHSA1/START domain
MLTDNDPGADQQDLIVRRVFDAPPELVFKAWTECEHLQRWWGPKGFTTPHCSIDLRPGGSMHYSMRSPEGEDYWGIGTFQEIAPPEKIVYLDSFADEQGNQVDPSVYGMGEWPAETLTTLTFAGSNGKTELTLHQAVSIDRPGAAEAQEGWSQSLDRLEEYLKTAA